MENPALLVILAVCILGAFAGLIYFFTSQLGKLKEELKGNGDTVLMEWLKDMKSSVEVTRETMQKQLSEQRNSMDSQLRSQSDVLNQQLKNQSQVMFNQTKLITERLENAQEVIRGVQNQLGGIQEFGKDIKDLSNVLKSPKLRGGLGEQFLNQMLADSLPDELYQVQYKFKDGNACDAVVFTDNGIIPIDSKFPMENFKLMLTCDTDADRDRAKKTFESDVKKRIDEISSKYILPDEGTTDQAIMYIPSENIFYELIVNSPNIEEYAKQRNIVMTSPNTLSYFLKVILIAYQQNKLQQNAGEILKALSGLKIESDKIEEDMDVLQKHISNSYKSMDGVKTRYQKFVGKLDSIRVIEAPKETTKSLL